MSMFAQINATTIAPSRMPALPDSARQGWAVNSPKAWCHSRGNCPRLPNTPEQDARVAILTDRRPRQSTGICLDR
jgi:hypothetical protein